LYLLDTNILSELVKKRSNPHLLEHISSIPIRKLHTPMICLMELRYGCALRDDFENFWGKIVDRVISQFQVISLGPKEGLLAGDLLAGLRKKGQTIGLEDILISSMALSHNLILITANLKHFSKVEGLKVENWLTT
jgi:tRNA(fMet)-specific endonuclease VapC